MPSKLPGRSTVSIPSSHGHDSDCPALSKSDDMQEACVADDEYCGLIAI